MKMKRKKQDCKEGKHFSLSKLLIPVSLVLISLSLGNILPDYLDKHNSSRTYENLRESYTKIRKEDGEEKEKDWWLTDVMIRFDELREENPDIVAWIRSDDPENTGIDYPVFYSGDNEKYLRRDLYGKSHIAGSIFLEGLNRPDFADYYTVIYGHNMNDGSMFGGLKKYRKKEFWEENPYFTLYTEGAVYRYQIFACHEAENGGDVYKIGYEPGEKYQKLIDSMVCNSLIDTGIHPDSSHKVMTLSTCTDSGYSRRFAVHAVCVDSRKTEETENRINEN